VTLALGFAGHMSIPLDDNRPSVCREHVERHGYVEFVNRDAATDAFFPRLDAASLVWEGADPIRSFAGAMSAQR
jgi:hypothetical protein